ncbi:aminoglycoside phosphotransferase family protein [Marinobacter salsuginis]|uniref:aminoglycoside phosphotransferase family protein n=1 Tax=Marinobacter salsuginis TaxID=418719 RepID=UPI001C978114|nr:aminoglycoside phosphotransferase family protein [Marinobacter salsuginis]MBY6070312.1 aminoglycoside phosphotransferase family protein [Marinobacter salsuginis]
MLFIKNLITDAGLAEYPLSKISMACISTSRAIYLVFNDKRDHPTFVIRKLSNDRDFQAHQSHVYLYSLVGSLVPKSLGVYEYAGANYDIQQGVKGSPWFQIGSKLSTQNSRARLETRLWETLKEFHSAIAADAAIKSSLRPHEELHQVYLQYKRIKQKVAPELEKLVELAVNDLSKTSNILPISQHGDFCLNNVIIDMPNITVIDFEDFGITQMPLYDHFTLALSLPSSSPEPKTAISVFNTAKIADAARELGIPENAIKWHFLHHILLRLGPWSFIEKRAPYRTWLEKLLVQFVATQIQKINAKHAPKYQANLSGSI